MSIALRSCGLPMFLALTSVALAAQPAEQPPTNLDAQFDRLDQNGDGRLTEAELRGRPFFDRADADGDGAITREEARTAMERLRAMRRGLRQRAQAQPPVPLPEGVEKSADLRYSDAEGGRTELLALDVYRPTSAKDSPVMVYIHGGGWTRGDKQAVHEKMPFFCGRGYIFVSVNYRMLPETKVPDQAQDVAAVVAWVHDHVKRYGGDPDRIFLMGHSAGAHLVSLVATNDTLLGNCGKDLSVLKGLIELDTAALDVPRLMESGRGLYPRVFGDDAQVHKLISPYAHVAPDKSIPPFLLVVAAANQAKLEQSNAMAKKLQEAGGRAEVIEAPDKTHGTLNQDLGKEGDEVTEKVMAFLESI